MTVVTSLEGTTWRKSSYSSSANACVEVGWRKSSFSGGSNACVEVARGVEAVGVRDSKAPEAGALLIEPLAWRAFVRVATH